MVADANRERLDDQALLPAIEMLIAQIDRSGVQYSDGVLHQRADGAVEGLSAGRTFAGLVPPIRERGLSRDRCGSCGSGAIAAVQEALGALGKGRPDLATAALEELLHLLERGEAGAQS